MWSVPGDPVLIQQWDAFRPTEVLYDFDGPKTFVHENNNGELFLAHWCDEDENAVRYVVVAVSRDAVEQLKNGKLTIRQVLEQPAIWVLDLDQEGSIKAGVKTRLLDLPEDVLPKRGTLLSASLEREPIRE